MQDLINSAIAYLFVLADTYPNVALVLSHNRVYCRCCNNFKTRRTVCRKAHQNRKGRRFRSKILRRYRGNGF